LTLDVCGETVYRLPRRGGGQSFRTGAA